jgi:hypothetical protein
MTAPLRATDADLAVDDGRLGELADDLRERRSTGASNSRSLQRLAIPS